MKKQPKITKVADEHLQVAIKNQQMADQSMTNYHELVT